MGFVHIQFPARLISKPLIPAPRFLTWGIEIKIRTATPNDVPIIADFNIKLAWETEQRRLDSETVLAGVRGLFQKPSRGTYYLAEVAENSGTAVVGQLLITYEWSDWRNGDFWWIQSVYVAANFRSQGIFRALFQHVQTLAKSQPEICGMRLYMDAHNDAARRAYERLGLKQTDYQVFELDFARLRE